MPDGHVDPTYLQIFATKQLVSTTTKKIVAKDVPETSMSIKTGHICHIYQLPDRPIWSM